VAEPIEGEVAVIGGWIYNWCCGGGRYIGAYGVGSLWSVILLYQHGMESNILSKHQYGCRLNSLTEKTTFNLLSEIYDALKSNCKGYIL
jgi:hypothetical protein